MILIPIISGILLLLLIRFTFDGNQKFKSLLKLTGKFLIGIGVGISLYQSMDSIKRGFQDGVKATPEVKKP